MPRAKWSNVENTAPVLALDQACTSWFVLGSCAYSVTRCPAGQFKAFVASVMPPTFHDAACRSLLEQTHLDDLDRWFVLLALASAKVSVPLYENEECAKKALRAKSEGAHEGRVQLRVKKATRWSEAPLTKYVVHS